MEGQQINLFLLSCALIGLPPRPTHQRNPWCVSCLLLWNVGKSLLSAAEATHQPRECAQNTNPLALSRGQKLRFVCSVCGGKVGRGKGSQHKTPCSRTPLHYTTNRK